MWKIGMLFVVKYSLYYYRAIAKVALKGTFPKRDPPPTPPPSPHQPHPLPTHTNLPLNIILKESLINESTYLQSKM